jgi:DNA-binding HxlR family transcriptional regulator
MRHKSFGNMNCPIARSLERVGEWWSILILSDSFNGLSRFDEFQENLGIAPNMLARRLKSLVEAGLLERRRYSERPPRYEYLLTQAGRDFRPVLWALLAWGNRHFAPEGPSVVVRRQPDWGASRSCAGRSQQRPPARRAGFSFGGETDRRRHTRRRYGFIAAERATAKKSNSTQ